jgi:transposase
MARSKYDEEFKASAADLVLKQGYSVRDAATSLGINDETLRLWVNARRSADGAEASGGGESLKDLRKQVAALKRENARLLMEREILKKATAFFAKEQR